MANAGLFFPLLQSNHSNQIYYFSYQNPTQKKDLEARPGIDFIARTTGRVVNFSRWALPLLKVALEQFTFPVEDNRNFMFKHPGLPHHPEEVEQCGFLEVVDPLFIWPCEPRVQSLWGGWQLVRLSWRAMADTAQTNDDVKQRYWGSLKKRKKIIPDKLFHKIIRNWTYKMKSFYRRRWMTAMPFRKITL